MRTPKLSAEEMMRFATRQLARRAEELDEAHQWHWGWRNRSAIDEASSKLSEAEADLANAREQVLRTRNRLKAEQASHAARHSAREATKDERAELRRALHEIDAALDHSRDERVIALAHDGSPPFYVVEALGEVPLSRGGQQAWCGLVAEIERYRDRHAVRNEFMALGREPQFGLRESSDKERGRVEDLIQNADGMIDVAHELDPVMRDGFDASDSPTWTLRVEQGRRRIEAVRAIEIPEIVMEAEPDLGIGW
jgi:hypothetical protein